MTEGEPGLHFRDMTADDLADGLRLSRASGWNQTIEDWRQVLSLGPGLFRVAVLDGRVVASGGAVRYGDALAWICMILVDPERRGQGLGTRIFDEVLERCRAEVGKGSVRCVGLDATPAGRGIYAQRGFVDGLPPGGQPGLVRMRTEPATARPPESVTRLEASALEEVLAHDLGVFGADRRPVLRWAFGSAPELAWRTRGGAYCFGRRGDLFDHVGPIVAEDRASALDLVRACLSTPRRRPLILDARAEPDWLAALGDLGLREQRRFTRMYLGPQRPPARPELELAVCGPEFG